MSDPRPAPDFLTIITNIAGIFPSIYSMLGSLFMLFALIMVFSGLLDLAQSSDKQKKYIGTHQASGYSAIIKILIAGILATTASNANMLHIASSIFFENTEIALISIDSYEPDVQVDQVQIMTKIVTIGIAQTLGILAIFKGLRIWAKASDKSSQDGFWHGFTYIIFGALLIQILRVVGVIQATIGFDFFKMVGLV
jgi:hypothetical protein